MIVLRKKISLNGLILLILAIIFLPFAISSQVKADFLFDKNEGCGSLAVSFTDQSTTSSGAIVDWKWDLGGTFSSKQNPGIIFNTAGEYTICLTVTNSVGNSASVCKNNLIKIFSNPVADFTVDQKEGCIPVKVLFDDLSKSSNGPIASWIWDIGGSSNVISTSDSTEIIGTTYSTQGNYYSATLSITDIKGCKNTITKPNLVKVTSIPDLNVDYSLINACDLPWEIKFSNLDPDPNADYSWNFGNGQSFIGPNPPNIFFNEAKSYTISVIVQKGPCIDTITFENLINTIRSSDFKIENIALCANQEIQLMDISNFISDSLTWDFGDGNTSKQANPSHIYSMPGCYKITLTKLIKGCIQFIEKPCIIVHPQPKVNFELLNGFSCQIPAPVKLNASADINGNFTWNVNGPGISVTLQGDSIDIDLLQFGQYKVDLLFKAENGCTINIKDELMDITKFEASLPSLGPKGCIPFDVILTDSVSSNVALASWQWEIGNPVIFSSNDENPVFKVTEVVRWDLRLIVENIYGCKDTITKKEYIQGGEPPVIDFVATPLEECLVVPRQFTSFTNNTADYWIWTINDTTVFSNEKDPLYTFNNFGIFDISLTVFQNGCANKFTRDDYIIVLKPVSTFDVVYQCDDPYTIKIQNLSLGADSLYWVVKLSEMVTDTIRDSLLNEYTFPDRGLYFLTHYGKSYETGCEHIRIDSIFIVDLKASYTLDTIRGCAPLSINVSSTIQDAVSTEFPPGQYSIIESDSGAIVTYTEGGTLFGPQLKVEDRHGCIDTFQTSTPIEISKINTQIGAPDVACVPGGEQMKDISIPGLGIITDREWYFSLNDQISMLESPYFDIPIEGNHFATLKLTDSWGCKDSIRKEILAVTLIPSFSSDTLSCTDRGIRFKIDSDPTFLDAFIWDFGNNLSSTEKSPLHFFDQEGVYDVCAEFFDSRGCSKKICKPKLVEIKNPKAIFTADPTSAPCPPLLTNFRDSSINANKYTWDFGDGSGLSYNNNPSHVYTSPGSFDVALYAEMIPGCVDTLSKKDFIQLLGPTAKIEYEIIGNCLPLEVRISAISDKKYEYIWDYGDGKINVVPGLIQADTTSYIYDKTGRFIPKLLVSDDNGCARTFTIDPIFVNDIKPKIESQIISLCGLPAEVIIENKTTSSSNDLKYSWTLFSDTTYLSQEVTPIWNILTYGNYSVQLIVSAVNCVDTLTQDSIFEVASIPIVDFEILSSLLCENIEVSILNNSVTDYGMIDRWNWDFGNGITSTDPSPNATFTKPGNYNITLKVITDKGCEEMLTKTVTVLPNTLISLTPNKTICIGDSLDLLASVISSDVYTYSWAENPLIKCPRCENINVKPNATSVFYFQTSSQSGCNNRDSIIVTVIPIPGPILQLSSDTIVCENSSIEISILNFNNQYNYQWDNQDAGLNCYSNCASAIAVPNDDTYYSIVVTNSFGCFKEDSILVTVERNIEDFLIPSKAICESDSTTISITGGNHPIWTFDTTISCTVCPNPLVHPDKSTYYTVTVISDAGCTYRDSILVEIIPLSSVDAGAESTICKGETIQLNGKGIGEVEWYSTSSIINKNNLQASSKPDISTVFYLQATKDECILSDSVLINVISKTEIIGVGDTICPKEVAMIYAYGNAQSYDWYTASKKIEESDNVAVAPIITTDYKVIGRLGLCENDTSLVTVLVHPAIDYRQLEDNYEVFINSKVNLKADFDENAGYIYHWSPAYGLNCIDCPEPFAKNLEQSTKYLVTIVDIYGCEIEQSVFVKYNDECSKNGFYIPNIFTPYNRDGNNDLFKVYAEDKAEFISISIFDRWGEKVYTSTDSNATWDGMYQGRLLVQGVYTFIITAKCDKTNEIFNFVGDVTIL